MAVLVAQGAWHQHPPGHHALPGQLREGAGPREVHVREHLSAAPPLVAVPPRDGDAMVLGRPEA
eukprot:4222662-Pyramimonas_sp.AAC.1